MRLSLLPIYAVTAFAAGTNAALNADCPQYFKAPAAGDSCSDTEEALVCIYDSWKAAGGYCWNQCISGTFANVCGDALPRSPDGPVLLPVCPDEEPESWSACDAALKGVSCNLGDVYQGDPYCWKDCDGEVWTHLCAGGGDTPLVFDCHSLDETDCNTCLDHPECGAWSSGCYTKCEFDSNDPGSLDIADASCYDSKNGGCQKEEADAIDWKTCSNLDDCASCMATEKPSGGGNNCTWFADLDGAGGSCYPEQGMMCCPVETCPEPEPETNDAFDCHSLDGNCDACLDHLECDGWSGGACYTKCSYDPTDPGSLNIADASCYDSKNGGCQKEQADAIDWNICKSSPTDCKSCMETEKPSGSGNCLWITDSDGNAGFCTNTQGMLCCAAKTCPKLVDDGEDYTVQSNQGRENCSFRSISPIVAGILFLGLL